MGDATSIGLVLSIKKKGGEMNQVVGKNGPFTHHVNCYLFASDSLQLETSTAAAYLDHAAEEGEILKLGGSALSVFTCRRVSFPVEPNSRVC